MKRSIHSMKEWECESGETHTVAASEQPKDRPKEEAKTPPTVGPDLDGEGDLWDHFVQDNWAPVLESAFGPNWRDKYPEEITAILWWAVKHRSRDPGTPGTSPTIPAAASTPGMTIPQGLPVGMGSPLLGIPEQAPVNAPLVFGTFRPQQIGAPPAQVPLGGMQVLGGDGNGAHFGLQGSLAKDQGTGFAAKDAMPPGAHAAGAIPAIPFDGFDSTSRLELPELGDVAFVNDDEEEPEGPASKRCNLDLSLNLEPMFGELALEDNSEDEGIDGDGLVRHHGDDRDDLDCTDELAILEEYDPEHPEMETRTSVQRPEVRRKVKRMGLHLWHGADTQPNDQGEGSNEPSSALQRLADPMLPPPAKNRAAGLASQAGGSTVEAFPTSPGHTLAQDEGGGLFGMPPAGLDILYDPEHPGVGIGDMLLRRGTQPPFGPISQMGGFTLASPARFADLKNIKFGTFASSNLVHQGRPMFGSFSTQMLVQSNGKSFAETGHAGPAQPQDLSKGTCSVDGAQLQAAGASLTVDSQQEADHTEHSHSQPVASPPINGQSELLGEKVAGVLEASKPTVCSFPQFLSTMMTPVTFGLEPVGGVNHVQGQASQAGQTVNQVFRPNQLYGMYGYGVHPAAAGTWGMVAPGGLHGEQGLQPGEPGVTGSAMPGPMLCIPSSVPMQYGVPVPVVSLNQSGQASSAGGTVQGEVSMPAMYVMDSRVAGHHIQQIIDGRDGVGRAPVHVAAVAGRADIIEQLIYVGCDCSAVLHVDLLGAASKRKAAPDAGPLQPPVSQPKNEDGGCSAGIEKAGQAVTSKFDSVMPVPGSPTACCEVPAAHIQGHSQGQFQGCSDEGEGKCSHVIQRESPVNSRLVAVDSPGSKLKSQGVGIRVERDPGVDELSFKFCNALHLATYYGHLNVVDLLLSTKRCDPQGTNEHGCTPLHFATNKGHKHIVARLLKVQGIKIDVRDVHGRTPLHHGAAQGHAGVIDELWPKGCKFDATDAMGWTALHYAAHAGHTDVVSKLVIAGCPVQKLDNCGYTAGHLAAQGGYADVLEKLLHAGYDPDTLGGMTVLHHCGGSTALHMAAAHGHANVVRQLLREGSNPSKEDFRGFTALQCAAEGGHLEAFQVLLEAGCNPKAHDCCGTTVLHSAANGGNWDIIRELLDLGCDHSLQTKYGRTALHHAAQGGAYQVAQNLLNLGCDIRVKDREGNVPWHAAAEGGNLEVLQLFLDRGCEIEAKNNAGCTALHCAAKSGSVGAVRALLDRGADIRAVSSESQTALHYAAEMGHDDVVLLLLETLDTLTVNHQDASGWTVLHHAAEQGNKKMVKLLIEQGADVNLQTMEGCTPLHLATHGQYQGVVEVLLENDCDTSIKDNEGCTALHYAAQRSNLPLFNLLHAGCMTGDKDNQGCTLLHYAVEGGNPDIVGTLLFTGAALYDNMDSSSEVMNALHLACKLGHAVVVSYLLKAGYQVGTKGPDGCQPLHYAAQGNPGLWGRKETSQHFHVVKLLLDAGADPHVVDDKGCNPLMYAAGSGELEMVLKFLLLGVDVTRVDKNQWTSMHWAATSGNVDVVSKLIQAGVAVDTTDNKGRLPLHWSAERGHLGPVTAIFKVMLEKKIDIHQTDHEGATAVQLAACHGHAEVVAKLLECGKTKDVKGLTALHLAAQLKMEEVARLLLNTGKCDVNARDADSCTPLHYSAENGSAAIVGMLLDAKADLNITSTDGMMPIHKASSEGHYEAVKKLIDKGALVNFCTSTGSTPLHYAASTGKIDVLKLLIDSGCPVNAMSTGNLSCTALYCAASSGQLETVDMLLQHGAEVDTICTNDCTALHVAASNGHARVVKRLLEAGADADLQAANGAAAIHNAVNNLHQEALEVLLAADCDVDIQNSGGNTALHISASKGSQELVREMLKAGCDVHIKNGKGWQAVQSAASNGFFEVVLLLVGHGAQVRQKGDMDVSKLLCRKSNLKASYVDGRLRLAEREKHRKAKPLEQAADAPTEQELKERQAQADAIMAELLAEEQRQRQAEEQQAAKRKAKKDKKKKRKDTVKEDGVKNDHTDNDMCAGDSSEAVAEDEDQSSIVSSALDVETVDSFAALSLADSPDTACGAATGELEPSKGRRQKGKDEDKQRPKDRAKEKDQKLTDSQKEQAKPSPSEEVKRSGKGKDSGEIAGPSSSQGTVKIIRCHNTSTPIIASVKRAAAQSVASSETQRKQTKRSPSAASAQERGSDRGKEPVVKIKAQRVRRKAGQSRQTEGHHGSAASNGPVGVAQIQKSSLDASSAASTLASTPGRSSVGQQSGHAVSSATSPKMPASSSKSLQRVGQIASQQSQVAHPPAAAAAAAAARATRPGLSNTLQPKYGVSHARQAGQLQVSHQGFGGASAPGRSQPAQPSGLVSPSPQLKAAVQSSRASPWQRPGRVPAAPAPPASPPVASSPPGAKTPLAKPLDASVTQGTAVHVAAFKQEEVPEVIDQSAKQPVAMQSSAKPKSQSVTVPSTQVANPVQQPGVTPVSHSDSTGPRPPMSVPSAGGSHSRTFSASGSDQGGAGSPQRAPANVSAHGPDQEPTGPSPADGSKPGSLQGARPWGPPGSMQGVGSTVSAAPTPTAWASHLQQQGASRQDEPGTSQPTSARSGLDGVGGSSADAACENQRSEAVKSPDGSGGHPMLSSPSSLHARSPSVPRVEFPFPGRTEGTWGVISSSSQLNGGLLGPTGNQKAVDMQNMHSGLGEPIVPPPIAQQQYLDLYGPQGADGGDQYAHMQGMPRWGAPGQLHEGGYLQKPVPGIPTMYPPAWSQSPAPSGPYPHVGGRTVNGDGARYPKHLRMGVTSGEPWAVNGPQTSSANSAAGDSGPNPGTRGSVANIPDDPWEIGDTQKPEPRAQRRRSPQPPSSAPGAPGHNQFCCPLTNKLMVDPVVAADGFTYERSSIEGWLQQNNKSPMTKQPMPHKELVPNLTMRAAIKLLGPCRK